MQVPRCWSRWSESRQGASVATVDDQAGSSSSFSSDDVCRVVGERVRDARRNLGLTMAQFAEVAEIAGSGAGAIDWGAVDAKALERYALALPERGYADTTRARKVASARSFCRNCLSVIFLGVGVTQ